ncbi:MAG: spherulation-specific family 4 protein [Alkalispirochaeta sp.]
MTERFSTPGVIIPLYVYPGGDGLHAWDAVAVATRRVSSVPVLVVVNPGNGPGLVADSNYRSVITELSGAGAEPVAYVALGYGRRSLREVHADLRRWRRLYPSVRGVFFDEVPVPNDRLSWREARRYVADISSYARGRRFSGTLIGNPGTAAPADYSAPDAFDLVVVHEDRWWPAPEALEGGPRAEHSVVLVYGDGVWDASRARRLAEEGRFLFVDDHSLDITGTGSSPWTFFPSNLEEQMQLLQEHGRTP